MKTIFVLALSSAVALGSCATGSSAPAPAAPDPAPAPVPGLAPGPVESVVILSGTDGKQEEASVTVVRDATAFASAWRKIVGFGIAVPAIDFPARMVVVAHMGRKSTGGWGYSVKSAELRPDGRITLTLSLSSPAPGSAVTQALTSPFIMVSLPATAADPSVVIEK